MLGHLAGDGWEFVTDPGDADVIVVNTCSFIEPAREESIRAILEAAERKRTGRVRRLVVAGCMVQRYAAELREQLPEVDAFVDLDELHRIGERVQDGPAPEVASATAALPVVRSAPRAATFLYDDATPRRRATPPWTAYVKIAEGCDHTCSFCAIPGFRGRFRSRDPESVVSEARQLAAAGVREINLIAQDSSHYGRDRGLREGLADLLRRLDEVQPLRWIRLHYLYPNTVTQELIDTIAGCERVVDYVDLPLQHAHRDVLARMRRGGSAEGHLRLLSRFREAAPDVALRTTLIVGFPGETEAEFDALLAFVERARFDNLGVFTYSHEEGTAAHALADDVPERLKQERRDRVMQLQQRIVLAANRSRLGRRETVLVEGAHPETEHLLVGRTARQAADVDGQILIHEGIARPGEFVEVEMRECAGYDLVGAIVGPA
jgi:ribosomal protein S12 methylthiotransferase